MDNKGSAIKIISIALCIVSIIGLIVVAFPYYKINNLMFYFIILIGSSIALVHTFILYSFGSMYNRLIKVQDKLDNLKLEVVTEAVEPKVEIDTDMSADNLLKQAELYLSDRNYKKAMTYANYYSDLMPNDVNAYLVKLYCDLKVIDYDSLKKLDTPLDTSASYQKVIDLADDDLKADIIALNMQIKEELEIKRQEAIYQEAISMLKEDDLPSIKSAIPLLESIKDYKDASELLEDNLAKATEIDNENQYNEALNVMNIKDLPSYRYALEKFKTISDYKDAEELIKECEANIQIILDEEEKERIAQEETSRKKKKHRNILITFILIVGILIGIGIYIYLEQPQLIDQLLNYFK